MVDQYYQGDSQGSQGSGQGYSPQPTQGYASQQGYAAPQQGYQATQQGYDGAQQPQGYVSQPNYSSQSAYSSQPYGGQQGYAPQPQPAVQPVVVQPQSSDEGLTVGSWVLTLLITAIPIVNIIMLFVWGFGSSTPLPKKNWALANLVWVAIAVVLSIVLSLLGVFSMASLGSYYYH